MFDLLKWSPTLEAYMNTLHRDLFVIKWCGVLFSVLSVLLLLLYKCVCVKIVPAQTVDVLELSK